MSRIDLSSYLGKQDGDRIDAAIWNGVFGAIQTSINNIPESGYMVVLETDQVDNTKQYIKLNGNLVGEFTDKGNKGMNVTIAGNNNINIEPRAALGTGADKNDPSKANRKGGNISFKPGDDIELCSHKRGTDKNTEVAVKVMDGSENPVKLQVFAGDITLSSKDKDATKKKNSAGEDIKTAYVTSSSYTGGGGLPVVMSGTKYYLASSNDKNATATDTEVPAESVKSASLYDDPNVMNINITTGTGKGYLKIRAQAIDLRCEENGGIALQPKGCDSDNYENKIKFEHGGGDGLEFGTFNTQHTSIFTTDYRFNKAGIIRLAERFTVPSDKAVPSDSTTTYKYIKNNVENNAAKETSEQKDYENPDDFYDFIDHADPVCTWEDIVKFIYWAKNNKSGKDWASLWP